MQEDRDESAHRESDSDREIEGGTETPHRADVNEGQFDLDRRRLFWAMPSGIYLLGSMAKEVRNLMTINWVTQVASAPKLIGVSIENGAVTHRLVEASGLFTLSIVSRDDRIVVRKFVKPAIDDRAAFTLNGIDYSDARTTGLPVLKGALGYFECRVHTSTRFESHTWFVGEVVDVVLGGALAAGDEVAVLSMGDTRMNYGG